MMTTARMGSVRGLWRRCQNNKMIETAALGESQPTWLACAAWNMVDRPLACTAPAAPPPRSETAPTLAGVMPRELNRVRALYPKTMLNGLLFVVPSMYGRLLAGTSATVTTHTSDTASATSTATAMARIPRRRFGGAATRYVTAMTGRSAHASTILHWNASPTQTPAPASDRSLPAVTARWVADAAR